MRTLGKDAPGRRVASGGTGPPTPRPLASSRLAGTHGQCGSGTRLQIPACWAFLDCVRHPTSGPGIQDGHREKEGVPGDLSAPCRDHPIAIRRWERVSRANAQRPGAWAAAPGEGPRRPGNDRHPTAPPPLPLSESQTLNPLVEVV